MCMCAAQALGFHYFKSRLITAEKECDICMSDVLAENGVSCSAGQHFYCNDCLKVCVRVRVRVRVRVGVSVRVRVKVRLELPIM